MNPCMKAGTAVLTCWLGIAAGRADGQSILTFVNEVVTRSGTPVPGIPGASFSGAAGLSRPTMQDDGRVLFTAQFFGGGAQFGVNDRALFWGDRSNLQKLVRLGDTEPSGSLPGATITQIFPDHALGANGTMMFGGRVAGPGITFSNDGVLYAGTPGAFQIIAREGSQAPGCPPGTTFVGQDFGQTQGILSVNAQGHVAFTATVTGAITGTAVFAGPPNALVRVLSEGEVVGPNLTVNALPTNVQINSAGQVLADLVNYQSVVINNQSIVGPDNNASVWLYTPGAGKQQVIREGQTSPIAGAKYADLFHGGTTLKCSFNAAGQTLLRSGLANIGTGTAVTAGVNDQIILLVSPTSQALVARKGDPAPGIPGATLQLVNGDIELRLNDAGSICFSSPIGGVGVSNSNDTAMWMGVPGNLTLVAREGNVAPGTGGLTFGDMPDSKLLNANGQVVFLSNLNGGGSSPTPSLWSWDAVAGLQLVWLFSDALVVGPGPVQPVGGVQFLAHTNGDARSAAFGDDGTLALLADFGVVKTRIGSLTGAPKTVSAAVGGTHTLFLNATAAHAGEPYLLVGSASGTTPGFNVGPFHVPLNLDFYTDLMVAGPNAPPFGNNVGVLNSSGRAVATVTIPPAIPGIAGVVLNHAFASVNGAGALSFVSEAASLTIVP